MQNIEWYWNKEFLPSPFIYEDRQGRYGSMPELPWRSRHFLFVGLFVCKFKVIELLTQLKINTITKMTPKMKAIKPMKMTSRQRRSEKWNIVFCTLCPKRCVQCNLVTPMRDVGREVLRQIIPHTHLPRQSPHIHMLQFFQILHFIWEIRTHTRTHTHRYTHIHTHILGGFWWKRAFKDPFMVQIVQFSYIDL